MGPRCNAKCANLITAKGLHLHWMDEMLLLNLVSIYRIFPAPNPLNAHLSMKLSLFSTTNAIFYKIGRIASEEVVLSLFKSKCLPVSYCMDLTHLLSINPPCKLQISLSIAFMKLFKTASMDSLNVIKCLCLCLDCQL